MPSDVWLFLQLWMLTWKREEWSWKTWKLCLCMKLSWWLARLVEAWMGQQFILTLSPSVGIIICFSGDMTEIKRVCISTPDISFTICVSPFIDAVSIVMIVTVCGVGLSMLIICMVMTCFSNHRRWDHYHIGGCEVVLSFILKPISLSFAGWKDVSGLLFQIRLIAASRDGHQNQHRCRKFICAIKCFYAISSFRLKLR